MLIAGLVALGLSVVLIFLYRSQKNRLGVMQSTQTSQVHMLRELAQSMKEGVGEGNLAYMTEVKGKVVCASPLQSELEGVECVYYAMRIEREYEETYYENDPQGRRQRRTRTGSDTVASNQRSAPFLVDDGTGQILVDPGGAEFVAEKVVSRFEPGGDNSGGEIRLGSFSLTLPSLTGDRRTLGYRFEEEAIPVGRELYVLGEAAEVNGELRLRQPGQGPFIISLKGEEELMRQGQSSATWMLAGSMVCALLGLGLLVAGLVKH
jgi:hypothetical protein